MKMRCRGHKFKIAVTGILTAAIFTGCGNVIPEMTDEQQKAIGEYAAITMLKYDAGSRSRLIDRSLIRFRVEEIPEVPEEEPKEDPKENEKEQQTQNETIVIDKSGQEVVEQAYASIADFLQLPEGIALTYAGYEVTDSYAPEGEEASYLSLEASEGKKLVILKFNMVNHSSEAQSMDMLSASPSFRANFNQEYTRTALMTTLLTDLSTYIGTLDAGEGEEVVLIVETDSSVAEDIWSIVLTIKNIEDSYTVTLAE